MILSEEGRAALAARIREVEQRSGAQVLVVVSLRARPYPEVVWRGFALGVALGAAAAALAVAWRASWESPADLMRLAAACLGAGLLGAALAARVPALTRAPEQRRQLVPRRRLLRRRRQLGRRRRLGQLVSAGRATPCARGASAPRAVWAHGACPEGRPRAPFSRGRIAAVAIRRRGSAGLPGAHGVRPEPPPSSGALARDCCAHE
jgi:hypothetical protein